MTPLDLAANLAADPDPKSQALAVAIVARGLSDDDPTSLRQGWPMAVAIPAAAKYLGLDPDPDLFAAAAKAAPSVSDAMLNKGASLR